MPGAVVKLLLFALIVNPNFLKILKLLYSYLYYYTSLQDSVWTNTSFKQKREIGHSTTMQQTARLISPAWMKRGISTL